MPISVTHSPAGDKNLWPDHPPFIITAHHKDKSIIPLAVLEAGTTSGKHSIMIKIPVNDPTADKHVLVEDRDPVIIVEITAREFLAAADIIRAMIDRDITAANRKKAGGN